MTLEAENYKNNNKLDYSLLSTKEFNTFPLLSGVYKFSTGDFKFDLLCVRNDDSSVIDFFWKGGHDTVGLNLWGKITKNNGVFIDVGSHTGLYTIIGLLSNKNNFLISIEPSFLNMGRMISNLRLNNLFQNNSRFLGAVSDKARIGNFKTHPDKTFMSKGGKISNEGDQINIIRLDDIEIKGEKKVKGIKIDTEGEDYKVLLGAKNIISKYLPEIIIEVREENKLLIHNFLSEFGYKFFVILDKIKEIELAKFEIKNSANIYASITPT